VACLSSSEARAGLRRSWFEGTRRERIAKRFVAPDHANRLADRLRTRLRGNLLPIRYGHDVETWALFEPFPLRDTYSRAITRNDPALVQAAKILGIEVGS